MLNNCSVPENNVLKCSGICRAVPCRAVPFRGIMTTVILVTILNAYVRTIISSLVIKLRIIHGILLDKLGLMLTIQVPVLRELP